MLDKIDYLGHELRKAEFELSIDTPDGNGFYRYTVENDPKIEISVIEGDSQLVKVDVKSSVVGYLGEEQEGADNEKVFSLYLVFTVNFEFSKDIDSIDDFISENQWFFDNYTHLASKEIADSILRHNPAVKNTYLPSYRIQ